MSDPFKILMVCTGNICRSPTAEGFLQRAINKVGLSDKIIVDSAGTYGGHIGEPPTYQAINFALERGVDIGSLRARKVTKEDLLNYDLILGMTLNHIKSLHDLTDKAQAENVKLYLDFSDDFKGQEVPDPYYSGDHAYRRVLDLVEGTTDNILSFAREKIGKAA